MFTEEGLRLAEEFLVKYFGKQKAESKTNFSRKEQYKTQEITNLIPEKAHIIRCTSKLLKELKVKPIKIEKNEVDPIRVWHANIITVQRKKCIIFTHSMSFYSFIIYGITRKELNNLEEEFIKHLARNLFADQIESTRLIGSNNFTTQLVYSKTNNRSVLASMNDIANQIKMSIYNWPDSEEIDSTKISQHLNKIPMGALNYGFPDRELKRILSESI